MTLRRNISMAVAVLGMLSVPPFTWAQSTPGAPQVAPEKTISEPRPKIIPALLVMNARGARLQGEMLTLIGVTPNTILFADRPVRAAGHVLTAQVIAEWGRGTAASASFAKEPPNATVSAFAQNGSTIKDAVVVLKSPKLDGDTLTFAVQVLGGDLAGAEGAAAVFIDTVGVSERTTW